MNEQKCELSGENHNTTLFCAFRKSRRYNKIKIRKGSLLKLLLKMQKEKV